MTDKEEFVQRMTKQINDMQTDINKMDDYKRVLNFVKAMVPQFGNAKPVSNRQGSEQLNGSINGGNGTKEAFADESAPMLGEI